MAKNQAGYFGVRLANPGYPKPYQARVKRSGRDVQLGCFATAEEAALCVARSPEGQAAAEKAAAAPPLTSEEARQQAQAEGLTLRVAENTTGFLGVYHQPGRSKPYKAEVTRGGKLVHLGMFATAEEAALCVARLRESNLQLAAPFIRAAPPSFQQLLPNYLFFSLEEPAASSLPVPPAASMRAQQVGAQQIKQGARRKRPRSKDHDGYGSEDDDGGSSGDDDGGGSEDEDGDGSEDGDRGGSEDEDEELQLAKALSLSATEAQAPPDERRERLKRRGNRELSAAATAPAARGIDCEDSEEEGEEEGLALGVVVAPPASRAAGSASSSNGNEDGLADEGGEQEVEQCGGCCFAGLASFAGESSDGPDRGAPEGGWGYTLCCGNPVHFFCLGKHLNPRDKLVDSTSGPVQMALGCPFCRKPLSRGSRRQLHAEGRCMHAVYIHRRLEHLALLSPTNTATFDAHPSISIDLSLSSGRRRARGLRACGRSARV